MLKMLCRLMLLTAFTFGAGSAGAQASYQGIWWAAPAGMESGWGINFTHQGDVVFATWFTYDASGRALWLVSALQQQAGTRTFSGDLFKTSGPAFSTTPFDPNAVTRTVVGRASVAFSDAATATFSYTVNGITQTKKITPQRFGDLPACALSTQTSLATASNYQGLWWAAPAESESGWGINLAQQGDVIFATWFTYDADRQPLWLAASLSLQSDRSFAGDLYRTTGPAFSSVPFDPAQVTRTKVGTANVRFASGNIGTLGYTVNGVTQSKNITQQVFRDQTTLCEPSKLYYVPTDVTQITYPDSYITPLPERLTPQNSPCDLNMSIVTYPQSWLGKYPLPRVNGAPLKASYGRGAAIKDIMDHDNPGYIGRGAPDAPPDGCKGDLQVEFAKTMSRFKLLGIEYVKLVQWHWASKRVDGSWYIVKAEDVYGSLSDADLASFVSKAHAAGIKVVMLNQIQGMQEGQFTFYVPEPTVDNVRKWFGAYQDFVLERSRVFQSMGIDVWELGCWTCIFRNNGDGSAEQWAIFASETQKALATMKANFAGKVAAFTSPWLLNSPDILRQLDILVAGDWAPPLTQAQIDSLTVESYAALAEGAGWKMNLRSLDSYGKTILFSHYWVQSRGNVLTNRGYLEETACTSGIGSNSISTTTCLQRETATDFSIQAIILEAVLEELNKMTLRSPLIFMAGEFYVTDVLKPYTAFPNIGTSPRGKPAEGILKAWFARP